MDKNKVETYRQLIDQRIEQLNQWNEAVLGLQEGEEPNGDSVAETIAELEKMVMKYGMDDKNVATSIRIILNTGNAKVFRNPLKNTMIRCLVPIKPLSNDTIIRIVGSIGINSKKRAPQQFIHHNLQTKLLRWLYLNVAINNVESFIGLKLLLPMLFNFVAVDYLSQWVSLTLMKVILTFKNDAVFVRNIVRPWRLKLLIDLNRKLSTDHHLVLLILLFQDLLSHTSSSHSYKLEISRLLKDMRISNVFKYPSLSYIIQLVEVKMVNDEVSLTLDDEFIENLLLSLQNLHSLGDLMQTKKRRIENIDSDTHIHDVLSAIESDLDSPDKKLSVSDFIDNYHKVVAANLRAPVQLGLVIFKFASNLRPRIVEIGDVIEIPTIDAEIYKYLFQLEPWHASLDRWCEVILVNDDGRIVVNEENRKLFRKVYQGMSNIQSVTGELFELNYKILTGAVEVVNETDEDLFSMESILRYVPLYRLEAVLPNLLAKSDGIIATVLRCVNEILRQSTDYITLNKILKLILSTISNVLIRNSGTRSVAIELELLELIKLIEKTPFKDIDIDNLILPPTVLYLLLLSNNPVIISEACKHILFTKHYFADYYSSMISGVKDAEKRAKLDGFKSLHNAYVMDICNLFWRDKLFEYHLNSSAKGFFLPQQFITQLQNITMSIEDDLKITDFFKKHFDLMLHPLFSNIILQLIRDLEDSTNCNIRYVGPIDELNFHNFVSDFGEDSNYRWIPQISQFEDFKIKILAELSKKPAFNGVSELLFNSLKSLLNKKSQLE